MNESRHGTTPCQSVYGQHDSQYKDLHWSKIEIERDWGRHQLGSNEDQTDKVEDPCVKEGKVEWREVQGKGRYYPLRHREKRSSAW